MQGATAHLIVSVLQQPCMQRVIDIFAARRIHAADAQVAHVQAVRVLRVLLSHGPGQQWHTRMHRRGEGLRIDVMLNEDDLLHTSNRKRMRSYIKMP